MPDAGRPSRLTAAFRGDSPALVAYLMAGYPDRTTSLEALRAAARGGAAVVELGVPYGNPLADGPLIAAAGHAARRAGFGLMESIELADAFVRDPGVDVAPPLVLMTYVNPLLRLGMARAADRMRDAGLSGVIVPDMPPEAAGEWLQVARGIDTVFLTAPTSTPERVEVVVAASAGFVYCVSATGTTGERPSLARGLEEQVRRVRAHTTLPVAVGFGVGSAEQAAQVARFADGVVVGSAIVRRQADPDAVERFVRELATAVGGRRDR